MEVEALEAIYMESFTKTSDIPLEWRLKLEPHPDG
ncbi:unnamed protein product, partial [Discosporangium mesarthrocarpum]